MVEDGRRHGIDRLAGLVGDLAAAPGTTATSIAEGPRGIGAVGAEDDRTVLVVRRIVSARSAS